MVFSCLLGLLSFAGDKAIGAVFTSAVVGQYISYSVPITARFTGGQEIKPGPFNLGVMVRYETARCIIFLNIFQSMPVAIVAVVFMGFMILIFMFPAIPNPGSGDMNYTAVVLGEFYPHFTIGFPYSD